MQGAPLILTLVTDKRSFERLDALRRLNFPPARNHLAAHVTMFHALPAAHRNAIEQAVIDASHRHRAFALEFPSLRFLGAGVAIDLVSPALDALRAELAETFAPWLGAQDRQRWRAHVTIQNKVAAAAARSLYESLRTSWNGMDGTAQGLALWEYLSGPWRALGEFPFAEGAITSC